MFKYETHLHTSPVSRCARKNVAENLEFYKSLGYDGVFITNHFIDGNANVDDTMSYEEKIKYFFSDYEAALKLGKEIGIKVFCGAEISYRGTDFLVYGLNKEWFLNNPQITQMKKREELAYMMENGALIIQAHPFREAAYIDHIRLFPRNVHGVEVFNADRTELENGMAKIYAQKYDLIEFAGSDNHTGSDKKILAGMCSETPIANEADFISRIRNGEMKIFTAFADDFKPIIN